MGKLSFVNNTKNIKNLTIRALLAPRLKLFVSQGPKVEGGTREGPKGPPVSPRLKLFVSQGPTGCSASSESPCIRQLLGCIEKVIFIPNGGTSSKKPHPSKYLFFKMFI